MFRKLSLLTLICCSWLLTSQQDEENTDVIEDTDGNISSYKDGKLHGKQVKVHKYSDKKEISYYDNGNILKKEYNYIWIEGVKNPTGIYKNGKPYEGYFPQNIKDVLLVDFYKRGRKKFQYSKEDIFAYDSPTLSVKSTYKKDKIYSGRSYDFSDKDGFVTINYLNKGKLTQQVIWVFAVHYANAITFTYNTTGFIITERKATNVKIIGTKHKIAFLQNDKEVAYITPSKNTLVNKDIGYYEIDGILHEKIRDQVQFNDIEKTDDRIFRTVLFKIFEKFRYHDNYDASMNSILTTSMNPVREDIFAQITYNNKGNPLSGVIVSQKNKKYTGKAYENGKLVKTVKEVSKDSITATYRKLLRLN